MNRFLTNATRVFMVPIVFAACSVRAPIQGTPPPAAVAEFLGVATSDPETLRLLALAGQPQPPGVPFICLSTQTQALFDPLEDMSTDTRKARQLAERLRSSFRAVTLDFPWGMSSTDPRRPPVRVERQMKGTPGGCGWPASDNRSVSGSLVATPRTRQQRPAAGALNRRAH